MKVYQKLAMLINQNKNCVKSNNTEWYEKSLHEIEAIIKDLPHGSGIDGKTEINMQKSNSEKIVINSEYHFMNDNGYYDGWENFSIIIKPSLVFDFSMSITVPAKYADVKDYLHDTFYYAFNADYNERN